MLKSLSGRVAVVTGGTSGVGRGIVRRFREVGIRVAVVGRTLRSSRAVADEFGADALAVAADVGVASDCQAMAEAVLGAFGGIDILCANAGIYPSAMLSRMTPDDFDAVMNTNLRGTFLALSAVLPALKRSPAGRVVLTSSVTGPITGSPGYAHYGASKAGQLGFMRGAALELADSGITVNAVLPGNVLTERMDAMPADRIAAMGRAIPLRRLASVADIANAVLFFASEEAGYITGQTLVVDGGQVLPEWPAPLPEIE